MRSVTLKFEDAELLNDLDLLEAPAELLEVIFPSGVDVSLGNELTPTQAKDQPTLKWAAQEGSFYTVLMVTRLSPYQSNAKKNPTSIFRQIRMY